VQAALATAGVLARPEDERGAVHIPHADLVFKKRPCRRLTPPSAMPRSARASSTAVDNSSVVRTTFVPGVIT
jgi:hypothetical protein